ncbi:MAG: AAA family ATPase [Sphingobacterium sp.]
MNLIYSWVDLYAKIVSKIADFENNHKGLINTLENIGIEKLNDKDSSGEIPLDDIDPFTFLSYLNKYGDDRRIELLNRLSKEWNLGEEVFDVCGLPTSNAQKVWLFPYKFDRINNEIERLWAAYHAVMNDSLTNDILQDIIGILSVGWTKITEGLFYLKPTEYLPLNRAVLPYLQSLEVNVQFRSYEGIIETCEQVRNITNKPFFEISYEGWLYADGLKRQPNYWRIGTSENKESILNEMLENNIVSIGWSDIGDFNRLPAVNKTEIQKELKRIYDYDNRLSSRKANEIINFVKKLSYNDYVVVMSGHKVQAIAKVLDQRYHYVDNLRFQHVKVVQWLQKDVQNLSFSEGSQTTFFPIQDPTNIEKINFALDANSTPLVTPNTPKTKSTDKMNSIPLNQILYGPPGTGKTYRTINKALSIIENKDEGELEAENRQDLKRRFKGYLDNGQIVFTTFHQSMSYEDFVEGIKPEIDENEDGERKVIYEVKEGIFKSIVDKAKKLHVVDSPEGVNRTFDDAWNDLLEKIEIASEEEEYYSLPLRSPNKTIDVILISNNGNLKLKPKNGREKGYTVSYNRIKRLQEAFPDLQMVSNIDKQFRTVIGGMNSSAYWAVLNYINTWLKDNSITTSSIAKEALPHVLIIDEINRGNVSAIFGELITLIEESKRAGKDEALEVVLPYSKEKFSVPSNLYLIGTMNTADRSVEALDTALRRRFAFTEMMPQPALIREDGALKETNGVLSIKEGSEIDLVKVLEIINKRIVALLDKDHQIGHSYLINVKSVRDLVHAFNNCIIPLLKEYFYHDEEKITLVLGTGFFTMENETMEEELFPANSKFRIPQSKPRLRIHTLAEDSIIEALNQLIG